MLPKVIFYQRDSRGHRGITQKLIADYMHPDTYRYEIYQAREDADLVQDLLHLDEQEKIAHCHILTLDDVLYDFAKKGSIEEIQSRGISLSGHLYNFGMWHPLRLAKDIVKHRHSRGLILHRLLARGLMVKVTIMDERYSNFLRYPMWHSKLSFLPDPLFFPVESSLETKLEARRMLAIPLDVPVFLMFGDMRAYKGLDVLLEAVSDRYDTLYSKLPCRIMVVAAGRWLDQPRMHSVSRYVDLMLIRKFISDSEAAKWFAAADCVLMPFLRGFSQSSGTFTLACATGNFVIVPDHALLSRQVKKFGNGYTFKSEKSASLAQAMITFAHEHGVLSSPVAGSVEYARGCTPDVFADSLDQVITSCILLRHGALVSNSRVDAERKELT